MPLFIITLHPHQSSPFLMGALAQGHAIRLAEGAYAMHSKLPARELLCKIKDGMPPTVATVLPVSAQGAWDAIGGQSEWLLSHWGDEHA